MPTSIKCPKCNNEFDIEDVLYSEIEQKIKTENQETLNSELNALQTAKDRLNKERQDFDEKKKKENELFAQRVQQEKQKLEPEIRKEIEKESGNRIKFLEEQTEKADKKIKSLEEKELEALRLKNENEELKRNVENEKKKYLLENAPKIIQDALSKEQEQFDLEKKALELRLDQQKRLIEEMERKANQGSMQTQGESQELLLEEMLRTSFPFDLITEVGKGVRGADCIQTVRNSIGQECGKIIFESKRTENFVADWIEKLKTDMHNQGADIAVIVTKTLPKDMSQFGEKQGVYICSYYEVKSLVTVLRNAILKIAEIKKFQENKGDRMHAVYDYVTGQEFRRSLQMMRENFRNLQLQLDKEKEDFEKNWQKKKKMIQTIIDNSSHVSGSIEGIAGQDSVDLNLLENTSDTENKEA